MRVLNTLECNSAQFAGELSGGHADHFSHLFQPSTPVNSHNYPREADQKLFAK
jgi:hypothetical protein